MIMMIPLKIKIVKALHSEDFNLLYLTNVCIYVDRLRTDNQVLKAQVDKSLNKPKMA